MTPYMSELYLGCRVAGGEGGGGGGGAGGGSFRARSSLLTRNITKCSFHTQTMILATVYCRMLNTEVEGLSKRSYIKTHIFRPNLDYLLNSVFSFNQAKCRKNSFSFTV